MNFPVFGDADAYAQLAQACAEAITGPGAAYDACYHPVRPVGAVLLMTAPFLITDDPVDAAYIALGFNLLFLAAVVAGLAAALIGDRRLLREHEHRAEMLAGAAFAALLPNLVAHVPVRLADLPSLAAFMGALLVAVRTAGGDREGRALQWRYLLCGAACALAVLLNVRYAAYSVVLLAALLAVDRKARATPARCVLAFAIGLAPVVVQLVNVYGHTGQINLYDSGFVGRHFRGSDSGIEAVYSTIPERSAYMVRTAGETGRLETAVLRLYRGLFGFEWSVYHGRPHRGPVWAPGAAERAAAWALVIGYLAFSGWVARRGTPSLQLLNLAAAAGALVPALTVHTELRYYILPRSVLWLTVAIMALTSSPRRAAGSRSAPRKR